MTDNNPTNIYALPYAKWLEKTLQELVTFPIKGICISATGDKGEVYVNYHECTMVDKLVISGLIQQDAMLDTLAEDSEGGESNGEEEVS